MRIALDAMGGDLAPKAVIEGAVLAARDFNIEIVLVGDRDVIVRELGEYETKGLPINIEHAAEVVAMDDSPLESLLGKPESSIHVGLEMVKRGEADGFVSAGNSGAMMAAAMAILADQLHGAPPESWRSVVAGIARRTGIDMEVFATNEIAGVDTLQKLGRGENAYMRSSQDVSWVLKRIDDGHVLADGVLTLRQ